ncbi:hypothetical protein [Trinickia sp. EG282A]|uniref:hypothetical protein n=1 Tax=Trinickia sp. EG282A TaxID=3237013 RepID=UPI0034D36E25
MPSKKPLPASLWFAVLALVIGTLGFSDLIALRYFQSPPAAQAATPFRLPADCGAGTLVTVVAHLDDDLLFVNPGITDRLRAGWCIVTVHLIGGANNASFGYVLTRERGVRQAYARMAGVPDQWTESTVWIAGEPVHRMVLNAAPHIVLLEVRLPGGQVRGGRVPLGLLWDEGETIATYPMTGGNPGGMTERNPGGMTGGNPRGMTERNPGGMTEGNARGTSNTADNHASGSRIAGHYDRAHIIATLGDILSSASEIYTLNPDTLPFLEHPDHIYAARITREAAREIGTKAPIVYHLTYVTSALPANVPGVKTQRKRDEVASYFAIDSDGGSTEQVFGEYEWNGNWVARRYFFDGKAGGGMPAVSLVNERTSECLAEPGPNATGGPASPRLATCDGSLAQQWSWRPLPSYPGSSHDAALVSVASSRCVAERRATLVEEPCDASDIAQRFTPWDFGIVRTPLNHCLGAKDGVPALAACNARTADYRWTMTPHSRWTDLRLSAAMYGDVTGDGQPSAVYVERRGDGPGFDVMVAPLAPEAHATRWYGNVVPFDSKAIAPTCRGDTLCFDSTRFLLADFEGKGRADLMVIAPAEDGGTAFWLLPNEGGAFGAPRLWYKTTPTLAPERAQQYVAGDFDGEGRADVMAAQVRPDGRGDDLWVLTSRGDTGNAPSLWRAAAPLAPATQFFAARVHGSSRTGLIAVEDGDGALAVSSIASSGRAFAAPSNRQRFAGLPFERAKIAVGPLDEANQNKGELDGLVVFSARQPDSADHANIDVWTIVPGRRFAVPTHAGTIAQISWADMLPALVTRRDATGGRAPLIALFERTNAPLDEFHFTGGAPALAVYPLDPQGKRIGSLERYSQLPGRYTETLRLDRLQ